MLRGALAWLIGVALAMSGCQKEQADVAEEPAAAAKQTSAAPTTEAVPSAAEWAQRAGAEVPLSHSNAVVRVAAGAADRHHVLMLGRRHAALNGRVVAKMRCLHRGKPCTEAQRTAAVGVAAIDLEPSELAAEGGPLHIAGVLKAAKALSGAPVLVLADRRVVNGALHHALTSLEAAGCTPLIGALNSDGDAVVVARQLAGEGGVVARDPEAKGLPERVSGIGLHVDKDGTRAVLGSPVPGQPAVASQLHGDTATAVSTWADRMAEAYPTLRSVTLAVTSAAAVADTIPLLDLLRDKCGKRSTVTRCEERARRFDAVVLSLDVQPQAAAPTPAPTPPKAPPGALSAEMLRGIGDHRARIAPPVPIPHDLLQPGAVPPHLLHKLPAQPKIPRPNLGGPPQTP